MNTGAEAVKRRLKYAENGPMRKRRIRKSKPNYSSVKIICSRTLQTTNYSHFPTIRGAQNYGPYTEGFIKNFEYDNLKGPYRGFREQCKHSWVLGRTHSRGSRSVCAAEDICSESQGLCKKHNVLFYWPMKYRSGIARREIIGNMGGQL